MERLFPRLREELTVRHLRTARRYLQTVGPDARVSEALRACEAGDYDVLPVLQGDRLVGLFERASIEAPARGARVRDAHRHRMQAKEVPAWKESEAQGRAIHPVEVKGLRSIMRAALAAPGTTRALGYADEADALRWLERLVRLRNRVMHVVRRLVADPRETRALHEEIQHLHALTRRSAREDGAPPLRKRPHEGGDARSARRTNL